MWILIGVMVAVKGVAVQPIDVYKTMEDCFTAREEVMLHMPKPKINYELVCVRTDVFTGV